MKSTFNEKYNSIEISFDSKPSADIRDQLKKHGFRWHNLNKLWYAKQNEKTSLFAAELSGNGKEEQPKPERTLNKYGVGVGDMFYMSWGYDQTNVDFFQVVELCGESSVRVRNVQPKRIESKDNYYGAMSGRFTYEITKELLNFHSGYNVFIKDNERGDIKRLQKSDGCEIPYIKIKNHYARLITSDKIEVYESWYA